MPYGRWKIMNRIYLYKNEVSVHISNDTPFYKQFMSLSLNKHVGDIRGVGLELLRLGRAFLGIVATSGEAELNLLNIRLCHHVAIELVLVEVESLGGTLHIELECLSRV